MGRGLCVMLVLSTWALGGVSAAQEKATTVVLETGSYWRYFMTYQTELVRRASGELTPLDAKPDQAVPILKSALPPADWAELLFDDGAWARMRGAISAQSSEIALICLRGRFTVTDPAAAGSLTLSLDVRGGAIVYLNGAEIGRVGLLAGPVPLEAPADDYPDEAYLTPEGFLYRNSFGDPQTYRDRLRSRIRSLHEVTIAASALVKGVNVLAVEIHRAPASEVLLTKRTVDAAREGWRGRGHYWWSRVGFEALRLTAPASAAGVVPNVGQPDAVTVWNHPVCQHLFANDHGDLTEVVRPMVFRGPRNSVLTAQVAVSSPQPIKALTATVVGDLKSSAGGASIPAAAVEVWYPRPDGPALSRTAPPFFDTMVPSAPGQVPVYAAGGVAIQPIWLTLRVPRDAKPGDYAGNLAISATGLAPVSVPLVLTVRDWLMPDPYEFATHVGLIQSPDSVAMQYKVEMWSPRHWELMEKSFDLLGQVGTDVVFIYLMNRSHFGNERGMVRWIRKPGGGYTHDFSIAEAYLDRAMRHLGKPEVVGLYLWEAFTQGTYRPYPNKGVPFTILDPATGHLEEGWSPKWGDPESPAFWKPVVDGMREMLKKRGLEQAMMFGVSTDAQPVKAVIEDLRTVAPDVPWISRGHIRPSNLHSQPTGYVCDVWGSPVAPDPARERRYGWRETWLRVTFPRAGSNTVGAMRPSAPLPMWYISLEGMTAAGIRGFGSMGADFWEVLGHKDQRNPYGGGWIRNIIGRYPESAYGQVYMGNSSPSVLGAGPDGAVPSVRFEMIRAAAQLTEARIFLEKALLDPGAKAKLGPELSERVQQLLDERTRAVLWTRNNGWLWFPSSGWQARDDRLYALCAETTRRLAL